MATHSSILDWRIPWTEEPSGPQSIGSQSLDTSEVTQHSCTCPLHNLTALEDMKPLRDSIIELCFQGDGSKYLRLLSPNIY